MPIKQGYNFTVGSQALHMAKKEGMFPTGCSKTRCCHFQNFLGEEIS